MLVCYACSVYGQADQYPFSHLDISNGLSHNQVNCIFKDSRGFMWFGTMMGLNRYDGHSFRIFKHEPGNIHSLNDNYVVSIFEAPDKKLWINTRSGLTVYDPRLEWFTSRQTELQAYGIPGMLNIDKIVHDRPDSYWFISIGSGIFHYTAGQQPARPGQSTEIIKTGQRNVTQPANCHAAHFTRSASGLLHLRSDSVMDLTTDCSGNIWLVYNDGIVECLSSLSGRVLSHTALLQMAAGRRSQFYNLSIDRDDGLWIFAANSNLGVFCLNTRKNSLTHLTRETGQPRLNSDLINSIIQDDSGQIWIATDHGGINILNKEQQRITFLVNRVDDNRSLRENTVLLYHDYSGIIWAGTFKEGISYYQKDIIRFSLARHYASDPKSLMNEDIDVFAEDRSGNLWMGTNGGGLICYNRTTSTYTQYLHQAGRKNSLSSDIIISLFFDRQQHLWIGTYFGGLDCFDGRTFTHFRHNDKMSGSLPDDRVWDILQDRQGRLWIGTFSAGLSLFNPQTRTFSSPYTAAEVRSPYVAMMLTDHLHNLWVAGYLGVDEILAERGGVRHFIHADQNPNSLTSNNVNSVFEDSRGLIWMCTRDGLSVWNGKTRKFNNFHKADGLPDDVVLNALEDKEHSIWLSTSNGLSRIWLRPVASGYNYVFTNYNEKDGLQAGMFNANAAFKTRAGELVFGGPHGFNLFDPAQIKTSSHTPDLIFTEFSLFGRAVGAGDIVGGQLILRTAIDQTRELTLQYDQNTFTVEFAALNFFDPGKINLQFKLQGFDKSWQNAGNASWKSSYTNLDPGNYTFRLRTANPENGNMPAAVQLSIHILPPFWKTPLAYMFYLLTIGGLLFYSRHRGIIRLRAEFAQVQQEVEAAALLEQERAAVKSLHELGQLKIHFLTNISHEFRTPISLIMAPVDKLLRTALGPDEKAQINMIRSNARRLLNLVNQLLDFRKIEVRELELAAQPGEIISFIQDICASFTDLSAKNRIRLTVEYKVEKLYTFYDPDKIERIFFNLLSNAFKFTPSGGSIDVLISQSAVNGNNTGLEIKVKDSGIGIREELHGKIFERFFQGDALGKLLNQGSGIGLAITREFVALHKGTLSVESKPGTGSCFTVFLPLIRQTEMTASIFRDTDLFLGGALSPAAPGLVEQQAGNAEPEAGLSAVKAVNTHLKPLVLVVEDNEDFRFYLNDNLKDHFEVIGAADGKEGWQKALALHPDLVVSDISMPLMNGIDLCKKIRSDPRTSQIPVILLTAITGEETQVQGLGIGASDYLVKPFNFEILVAKVRNLLTLKENFKKTYQRQLNVELNGPEIMSGDEILLNTIVCYIQQNILNPALSVEELSRQMNMSRVSLYKKVIALTGKSPVEYIRFIRLRQAAKLLVKSSLNITGVCYEVGFNNPAYFTKMFREEYKMLPTQYRVIHRKNELTEQ